MKLTIKQENFCNKYLEYGNASEAYRCVYSCGRMKDETVNNSAYKLLSKGEITARVKELQIELKAKSDVTKEDKLEMLHYMLKTSIADFHKSWHKLKSFNKNKVIPECTTNIFNRQVYQSLFWYFIFSKFILNLSKFSKLIHQSMST